MEIVNIIDIIFLAIIIGFIKIFDMERSLLVTFIYRVLIIGFSTFIYLIIRHLFIESNENNSFFTMGGLSFLTGLILSIICDFFKFLERQDS